MAEQAVQQRPAKPGPLAVVSEIVNGRHPLSKHIPMALLAIDVVLCGLILKKVPYTEIDWRAYMQQAAQFLDGERDYTNIKGDTGPLVYPAAHVWIYSALYFITGQGKNIALAQLLFAMLYIATLGLVMMCYWKAKAPAYIFPLLIASKRLHSIFMLRCFNDGIAVFFLWLAMYYFQRRQWTIAAMILSLGVGVKMSLLLTMPAVGVVLFLGHGFTSAIRLIVRMGQVQAVIALPFLSGNSVGYLSRAFDFTREFLFKWTVNWRFIGEDVFLSKPFATVLLALHVGVLIAFILKKWLKVTGMTNWRVIEPMITFDNPFGPRDEAAIASAVTPQYMMTTILTANVVGLLFARSLHYQFYAYLAWSTPFLLWRSGIHPIFQYALFFAQEWAWNVYPSTPLSSFVVVSVMAATVMLVWKGANEEYRPVKDEAARR